MECDEAHPLLDAYLDGELGEAERAVAPPPCRDLRELRPGGGGA